MKTGCCPNPARCCPPLRSSAARGSRRAASAGELAAVLALVVLAILAGADRLPPPGVVAVPVDRLLEALGEAPRRLPAELADLRARERVAAVVPGPVGHVLD